MTTEQSSYMGFAEDPAFQTVFGKAGGISIEAPESAMVKQVGGNHYKEKGLSMQPWAIVDAWGLDFYAGNVLKYLLRYRYKDGVKDLRKARHYLDKMIEDADDQ